MAAVVRCACRCCSGGKGRTALACSRSTLQTTAPSSCRPPIGPATPGWPCSTPATTTGHPRPDEVKKVLDQAAKQLPGVKVRIGRMSDFADAILAQKPDLPVVRCDAPDSWIHGPMSDPAGARLARNTRPLIAATDALNTQLRGWGLDRKSTRLNS